MKPVAQPKRTHSSYELAGFYADVLMTLAEESFAYSAWKSTLANLSRLVEDDEVASLIRDPSIPAKELAEYMDDLMVKAGATSPERRFVERLIDRGHFHLVPLIRDAFTEKSNKALGICEAHVVSAKPMTLKEELAMRKILSERFNVQAKITKAVNETLIAGYIIRIDGRTIDQSTRGYRERMAKAGRLS